MKDVEKILTDVYMIKQPLQSSRFPSNWYVGILVFFGKSEIGLVDTGFENTPADYIFPLIKELGRNQEEISRVVITHRDGDHIRGNTVIREKTNAQILAHELEVEAIEDVDVRLKDGDTVGLGDRRLRVIHTPGHRPGAICLYDADNFLLVTGDVVCGDRVELIRMEKELYVSSLQKLLDLETRILLMGHPFNPFGRTILTGTEPRRMIEASIAFAEKT